MSSPIENIMKAVYCIHKKEFDLILKEGPFYKERDIAERLCKSEGAVRQFFSRYGPALKLILEKDGCIKANTLGKYVRYYVSDLPSIQLIESSKPTRLIELYTATKLPGIFKEVVGRRNIRSLTALKKRNVIKKGVRRKDIETLISSGKGILRILDAEGQKLVNDLQRLVNLISYYAMRETKFTSIMQHRNFWNKQLIGLPFERVHKVSGIFSKTEKVLKQPDSIHDDQALKDIKTKFLLRVCYLPLERVPNSEFVLEGRDIVKDVEHGNVPDLFTLGMRAYL